MGLVSACGYTNTMVNSLCLNVSNQIRQNVTAIQLNITGVRNISNFALINTYALANSLHMNVSTLMTLFNSLNVSVIKFSTGLSSTNGNVSSLTTAQATFRVSLQNYATVNDLNTTNVLFNSRFSLFSNTINQSIKNESAQNANTIAVNNAIANNSINVLSGKVDGSAGDISSAQTTADGGLILGIIALCIAGYKWIQNK